MRTLHDFIRQQDYVRLEKDDDTERADSEANSHHHTEQWRPCNWLPYIYSILTLINVVTCVIWLTRPTIRAPSEQGLASDRVFGNLPRSLITWEKDPRFTNSDPWYGQYWNNGTASKGHTPWDDLYRSGWIEVENPAKYGLSGGVPLAKFAAAGTIFSEDAEGYNVALLHQLHCVGTLKHILETGDQELYGHSEHCIEYLRQSIICNGDLTLEPPAWIGKDRIKGTTGWGNQHYCRDWTTVHDELWSRLIRFVPEGPAMRVIRDRFERKA